MPPDEEQLTPEQAGDPYKTAFRGISDDEQTGSQVRAEAKADVSWHQVVKKVAGAVSDAVYKMTASSGLFPERGTALHGGRRGAQALAGAVGGSVQDRVALHNDQLRWLRDVLPALLPIMQATNPDMVDEAARDLGRLSRHLNMTELEQQRLVTEPYEFPSYGAPVEPAQETGAVSPVHEEGEEPITTPSQYTGGVRGQTFGDAPDIFRDQRPSHPYRNKFGGFTQVARVDGGIYTAENPPAEMAIDVTRLMDGNVRILVASRNPTGVTSAGEYDGALGYDYLADQPGFTDTPSEGQRNVGRELVREIDSDGNRTGRAVLGSGFRGGEHPTGVAFHMYPMLREGFAAGVDNFHSLYDRTNRVRNYTYYLVDTDSGEEYVTKATYVENTSAALRYEGQPGEERMAERVAEAGLQEDRSKYDVVLRNEGIKNVRDLAYIWTATGQPNRQDVFEAAIELTDSSLGKDDDGLEKINANDLRQAFVITLASTGVEAGDDGVIEHIRQITGYDAAEPGDALSTFKTEFQEGMKMATEAGPGRRLVNGAWTGRGRGTNANSIWKAETIDAFFEDVAFTIEGGDLYVTMPNRGGTGTIRLRWGTSPSAEVAA